MLHVLGELIAMRHVLAVQGAGHEKWVELDADQLQSVLPFWAPIDIRRIQSNLRELGLLKVSEGASHLAQRFEIDDGCFGVAESKATAGSYSSGCAGFCWRQ